MTATTTLYEALGRPTIHPFPARMAPGLALGALSRLRKPAIVLDPMVGSGTVVALARAGGHHSIGFDVDPLAVLIASVWTRTINARYVRECAKSTLDRAKRFAREIAASDAYPLNADEETRAFVRYWFDDYVRCQLSALATAIAEVDAESVRDVLWCAFSRQIVAKQAGVSLALDLAHSRPHRAFERAPRKPFRVFLDAVERVVDGCLQRTHKARGPVATITLGDARKIKLRDRSVDLVFTSPPYLNAIDYLRCSKFSLVWMGYSIPHLRRIRANSIGTEVGGDGGDVAQSAVKALGLRPALSTQHYRILQRYAEDMLATLRETARVLAQHGRAVYVVGENTLRGTYIPTARLLKHLARTAGLGLADEQFRKLAANRRYLPPPGKGQTALDTRIRREVVLTFVR